MNYKKIRLAQEKSTIDTMVEFDTKVVEKKNIRFLKKKMNFKNRICQKFNKDSINCLFFLFLSQDGNFCRERLVYLPAHK